ncbi:MAG TPA: hypothetical protein VGR57_08170 [Ktedonobacterales bacterium]|nr:hypothetical protein [Ktedonobacterales bacterium]
MARLRTISRWLVVALVALVAALILLHQALAGGHPAHQSPGALPTARAPHAAIARTLPVDERRMPLSATMRA